jgi:hypothetical protein
MQERIVYVNTEVGLNLFTKQWHGVLLLPGSSTNNEKFLLDDHFLFILWLRIEINLDFLYLKQSSSARIIKPQCFAFFQVAFVVCTH